MAWLKYGPYMAEEPSGEQAGGGSTGQDQKALLEALKASNQESMKALLAEMKQEQESRVASTSQTTTTQPTSQEPDYWGDLIQEKAGAKISQAAFHGQAAEDASLFYSGDFWLEKVDEWLLGETESERKAEKKEFRQAIEKKFKELARENRAHPREDIAKFLLAESVTGNKEKLEEKAVRKSRKAQEDELEKAKAAVSITGGSTIDFRPEQIYSTEYEKWPEAMKTMAF